MRIFPFLFEISDKVVEIHVMYILFIIMGGIGLLLGFWRWWISAIWFVFPTLAIVYLFAALQNEEINNLYEHLIRELGHDYIVHNFVSPLIGVALNVTGIGLGLFRKKKERLR